MHSSKRPGLKLSDVRDVLMHFGYNKNNTRILTANTVNGEHDVLSKEINTAIDGANRDLFMRRVNRGWSPTEALVTPRKGNGRNSTTRTSPQAFTMDDLNKLWKPIRP